MPPPAKARARRDVETIEVGQVRITEDQPEVGLVTLAYEAAMGEYNLDAPDGEQNIIVPTVAFRRAVRDFLGMDEE